LEEFKIKDAKAGIYKKVILENGILVGAVLAGRIENSGVFLRMIQEKINVSSFKERLLSDNFGYPDILALVKERESIYV
jgi:NAD(P)H-nitrite reductase large subunit